MTHEHTLVIDQAIAWHLRLEGCDEAQWLAFVDWLEADEAHRVAYDRLALDDAMLAPRLELEDRPRPVIVPPRPRWHAMARWGGMGSALAASIAVAIGFTMVPDGAVGPDRYTVETAAGMPRTIALADGTAIEMNGGTRLQLDRNNLRYAALERGEAVFRVHHDAGAPFTVHSGETTVQDVGTVFNLSRRGVRTTVQVAEGAVMYEPDREAVMLHPGQALTTRDGEKRIVLSHVETASVGQWRQGRVTFRSAAFEDVVGAVERRTGTRITLPSDLAERPFTGSVRLDGNAATLVPQIAALGGASARRTNDGWILASIGDDNG